MTQQKLSDTVEPKFVMRYSHVEVVAFPLMESRPPRFKDEIPWENLDQRYAIGTFYMGEGRGWMWYARGSVIFQDQLRTALKLEGGEDRLKLLADALFVDDQRLWTKTSAQNLLVREGDAAVPYLEAGVKAHRGQELWCPIQTLGAIYTDRSTELLRKLYASDDTREYAGYALMNSRLQRPAAKSEFLDMLRRGKYVVEVCEACAKFQWKEEAAPLLDAIFPHIDTWWDYNTAFMAKRQLDGRPIPTELLNAERDLFMSGAPDASRDALAKAKETLIKSADPEAAAVLALNLVLFNAKGPHPAIEAAGLEVLHGLPPAVTRRLLTTLAENLKAGENKARIAEILKTLDAGQ
jgi:hypothetical protein